MDVRGPHAGRRAGQLLRGPAGRSGRGRGGIAVRRRTALAGWSTYDWVDDADLTATKVRDAGGAVLVEPFDFLHAGRMAVCADRAGAVFDLWQPGTHRGAQLVNAPGTWNWSDLHTTDVEGAKAFYGAVFGWEASTGSPSYATRRAPSSR